MKDRLERLYKDGKLTKEQLQLAINKGWISESDYTEIIA